MTDKEVSKTSEDKPAEVAPYLSAKKENENDTSNKTSTVVPVVIILIVAVIIIASFFEDEYKSLIASLNPATNTAAVSEETISMKEADSAVKTIATVPVIVTKPTIEVTTESAEIETATASIQEETRPGLITVYNPYLRPYPQVYAPITPQPPYGMPVRQAKAYIDMIQKRQKAVADMIEMRNAAMQRMEKDRLERMQKMELWHAQAQVAHAEILKRKQQASRI